MTDLTQRKCEACEGGVEPLAEFQIEELKEKVPGWSAVRGHHLHRDFSFKDFSSALSFVNEVGVIAENEGHHPDIFLTWGKVGIDIWTHSVDGLTENDFILAAKINELKSGRSTST